LSNTTFVSVGENCASAVPKTYVPLGEREFVCAQCKTPFTASHKRKYCTSSCSRRVKTLKRNPNAVDRSNPKDWTCVCKGCGVSYKNKRRRTNGEGSHYCSQECAWDNQRSIQYSPVHTGYCIGCGKPFVSRRKRQYCNDDACKKARDCARAINSAKSKYVERFNKCKYCGKEFASIYGSKRKLLCSADCAKKHSNKTKARGSNAQRAKQYGVDRGYFNEMRIFVRDRWTCQLCKRKTPKKLRGTYDSLAPELDHIVPLSKGGAHRQENLQCACRECNLKKSDKAMGQLWLLGIADVVINNKHAGGM
jgi:5-methylcytosine-specific restriction endonuclease McrA